MDLWGKRLKCEIKPSIHFVSYLVIKSQFASLQGDKGDGGINGVDGIEGVKGERVGITCYRSSKEPT